MRIDLELYVGVDGGQSSTRAVVGDQTGRLLGFGTGGPANHWGEAHAEDRLRAAIEDSVQGALDCVGVDLERTRFTAAYFSMTGGPEGKVEIARDLIHCEQILMEQDTRAAWAGALDLTPGVVVIGGTGTVAYGCRSDGTVKTVGGFGHIFGDEGGAFFLAKDALRVALEAEQGWRETGSVIRSVLLKWFNADSADQIRSRYYSGQLSRENLAGFSKMLIELSIKDSEAAAIVDRASRALAELAVRTVKLLDFTSPLVSGTGGVLKGERVWRSFRLNIEKQLSGAKVQRPAWPPVVGALLLAYGLVDPNRIPRPDAFSVEEFAEYIRP